MQEGSFIGSAIMPYGG